MKKITKDRNKKTKYYNDHLAVADKEISSRNFCTLVDTAVLLCAEEEQDRILKSNSHTKTETLSEKEEDRDKRIYHLFPRKPRSSVKKFAPPQNHENLNGASTSSPLLDLNTIPDDSETEAPSNPLQCLSYSSSPSFLAGHSELNFTESHPCSSTLLVDYNMAQVEKTEMTTNTRNPDSQSIPSSSKTEKTSSKRRAVQEIKRNTGVKSKKATVPPFSWIGRATPEWLVNLMETMAEENLVTEGPWNILEKKLTETDVKLDQSRLLMPFKSLIRNDFLNPVELRIVAEEDETNGVGAMLVDQWDEKNGVGAMLVDQRDKKWGLILMRREMKKDSGNGTSNYALICGWNDVVEGNGLKVGDDISVWYFRWRERLCFALVLPPPDMVYTSSSLDLCV